MKNKQETAQQIIDESNYIGKTGGNVFQKIDIQEQTDSNITIILNQMKGGIK